MTTTTATEPKKEVTFETLLERLEVVVRQLESGEMSLEASIKTYEKGVAMVRDAQERLGKMEGKIEELMQDGSKKSINVATTADDAAAP